MSNTQHIRRLHLVANMDIVVRLLMLEPTQLGQLAQHDCVQWLRAADLVIVGELPDDVKTRFGAARVRVGELLLRALSGEAPEPRAVPNRHWRKRASRLQVRLG